MVTMFVSNGIGPAPTQASIVKVNGVAMSLDDAETTLLKMEMPARCSALTMGDAKKLQRQKGFMVIDGVGSTVSFLGTVAEWQGQQEHRADSPWPKPQPRSRYYA